MPIEAGRAYRLRNKKSDLYLNVAGYSRDAGTRVEQWHLQSDANRDSQVWHLMPLDGGEYLIVNKRSGLFLTPDNFLSGAAFLTQWPLNRDNQATQTWLVKEQGDGTYRIAGKAGGLYLRMGSTQPGQPAEQQSGSLDALDWALEVEDEYKEVFGRPQVDADSTDIGDVHRLTGFRKPRDRTGEVLLGRTALPFPAVQDGAREWQAANSPYYLLSRYGYWELSYYYEHGGTSQHTKSQQVTLGLTTSNSRQIEQTAGISVTADAGFALKGFPASLSSTVSHQLKVTLTSSTTQQSSRTDTVTRHYHADRRRIAEALWYRGDHYVLTRIDGTRLLDWRTLNPDVAVNDGYPGG